MLIYKDFFKQTSTYIVYSVISRLSILLLTPLYTRIYSKEIYGIFTEVYSWISIINSVLTFGMETAYFRFIQENKYYKSVHFNIFIFLFFIASIFSILCILNIDFIARIMSKSNISAQEYKTFIKYIIIIVFLDVLSIINLAKIRIEKRPVKYNIVKISNVIILILMNTVFIIVIPYIIKNKLYMHDFLSNNYKSNWIGYVFISNVIASFITFVILIHEMINFEFKINLKLLKEMLKYSFPLLFVNLFFNINENASRILISIMLPSNISLQELGVFGACSKLAIFINIFIQAFRLGMEPFFFNCLKFNNAKKFYGIIMKYFIMIICAIYIAIIANISILKYLIDVVYWEGLPVVPILLLSYVFLGIYSNISMWYKLSDSTRYGFYISCIGTILTLFLNYILIPKYSYYGSSWSSLITYFIMTIISYYFGNKKYYIPYDIKNNILHIAIALIISLIICFLINYHIIYSNILLILYILYLYSTEKNNLYKILD